MYKGEMILRNDIRKLGLVLLISSLVVFMAGCSGNANGESSNYPDKSVTLVVPFGPGGDSDLNARSAAKALEEELGKPVVVTNIEGAGGSVGTKEVLNGKADGYTALFNHNAMILNNVLEISDVSYTDFKIAGISASDKTNAILVRTESKYKTINDVIEDAKENPGQISAAVSFGNYTQLVFLALEAEADIDLNIIDVGVGSEQRAALSGERADMITTPYGQIKDYIESGEYRSLGLATAERVADLPDEPTLIEQGVDVVLDKHYFYFFPKETPNEVVETFTKALKEGVNTEEFKKTVGEYYITPDYYSPEETLKILEETEKQYLELSSQF